VDDRSRIEFPAGAIVGIGALVIALLVVALLVMFNVTTYDVWAAVFIAPVLIGVSIPILARQARRDGDVREFRLLFGALLVHLLGAVARYIALYALYRGVGDSNAYHAAGTDIAHKFLSGNFDPGLKSYTDTGFIDLVTGIVYTITRPTLLGGFMVFSWLSFWGSYFFYRAFRRAVPGGRVRTYALLLFFLPSMVYWPSSTGKEAWMMFAIGIATYGCAVVLTSSVIRGMPIALLGLAGAGMVRGHEAGVVGIALALALLLRRPRRDLGVLAPLAKGMMLVIAIVVGVAFYKFALSSLQGGARVETSSGIASILEQTVGRTSGGHSEFTASPATSPGAFAKAAVTVLFRPFIIEAHNGQALFIALESSFLLFLCVRRAKRIWAAIRSMRDVPFIAFSIATTIGLIIALSSFSNFGILARQRVLLYPFLFVVLAVPGRLRGRETEASPPESPGSSVSPPEADSSRLLVG
jgi:hypothetical protein